MTAFQMIPHTLILTMAMFQPILGQTSSQPDKISKSKTLILDGDTALADDVLHRSDIMIEFGSGYAFWLDVSNPEHTAWTGYSIVTDSSGPIIKRQRSFPYPELILRVSQAAKLRSRAAVIFSSDIATSDDELNSRLLEITNKLTDFGFQSVSFVRFKSRSASK